MADADWKYLQYNVETGQKRTNDGPDAGPSSLADLDDTNISNPSDGQMLSYDATEGKWKNAPAPEGSVTDVQVDGQSVVNSQGVAEIQMPSVPVQDVQVDGSSVVNAQGIAEIQIPTPPRIYSLQEREIGVWADGKPLYEKTVTINVASLTGNDTYINHGISNIDYCINARGIGLLNTGGAAVGFLIFPDAHSSAEWEVGIYNITDTFFDIHLGNGVKNIGFQSMYITLQYTKTTDTAGLGIWAGNGAMAHHYSTDEVIVGTWIDGKPIYERVINLGETKSIPSNQWTAINNVTLLNCNLIDTKGIVLESNNTGSWAINGGITPSTGLLEVINFRSSAIAITHLIIQYTKTTD